MFKDIIRLDLEEGVLVIRRGHHSEWFAPLLLCLKLDGKEVFQSRHVLGISEFCLEFKAAKFTCAEIYAPLATSRCARAL
jgi:hypothetical protein